MFIGYQYIFFIDSTFISSADVHITVADVNEYIPEWSQEEYSATVEEGVMTDNILTVTATDRDCSPSFGEICSYAITSPDQPFRVSSSGVISTTQPLSSSVSRSHVVSVVAVDCGGRESSPVLVTIVVSPHCSTSWSGQCPQCPDSQFITGFYSRLLRIFYIQLFSPFRETFTIL